MKEKPRNVYEHSLALTNTNVPELPAPRTLEDVTRDYLKALDPVIDPRRSTRELLELQGLREEMRNIIRGADNE